MSAENAKIAAQSEYARPNNLPYITYRNAAILDRHLTHQSGKAEYRNCVIADVAAYGETKCIVPKEVKSWTVAPRIVNKTKTVPETKMVQKEDSEGNKYYVEVTTDVEKTVEEVELIYEDSYPWFDYLKQQINAHKDPAARQQAQDWHDAIVRSYEHWKEKGEVPVDGIPLIEWRGVDEGLKSRFIELGINTVEKLAGCGEEALQAVGMGSREAKKKAENFLTIHTDANQAAAMVSQLQDKLDHSLEQAKAQSTDYEQKLAQLQALVEKQAQPKKRGRPRKEAKEAA